MIFAIILVVSVAALASFIGYLLGAAVGATTVLMIVNEKFGATVMYALLVAQDKPRYVRLARQLLKQIK
jgi:gas vesicle protein